jgi:hypothetical protein
MSPLTTKEQSLKFESKTPCSTGRRPKKPRKAQEYHLKKGKPQKPINDTKSDKDKQNSKEKLRRVRKALTKAKDKNRHSP